MGKSRKTTVTVTVNENFQIEMVLYYEYVVGIQLKYTLCFQFNHSCHFTEILGFGPNSHKPVDKNLFLILICDILVARIYVFHLY